LLSPQLYPAPIVAVTATPAPAAAVPKILIA